VLEQVEQLGFHGCEYFLVGCCYQGCHGCVFEHLMGYMSLGRGYEFYRGVNILRYFLDVSGLKQSQEELQLRMK
jgi:hypothetical protein